MEGTSCPCSTRGDFDEPSGSSLSERARSICGRQSCKISGLNAQNRISNYNAHLRQLGRRPSCNLLYPQSKELILQLQ